MSPILVGGSPVNTMKPIARGRPPELPADAVGTVAVIVAAWQADRWIENCLSSVAMQRLPNGVHMDLRIGVDACEATAKQMNKLQRPYWWSDKNVGPYVIRNSLIALAPADWYAIFDADDLMSRTYLTTLCARAGKDSIAGSARLNIKESGGLASGSPLPYGHGVCVISHRAWEKLGGYKPWRYVADVDLIRRAKKLGVRVTSERVALYRRRKHDDSISATGSKTSKKNLLAAPLGELHVDPVTTRLERRGDDSEDRTPNLAGLADAGVDGSLH